MYTPVIDFGTMGKSGKRRCIINVYWWKFSPYRTQGWEKSAREHKRRQKREGETTEKHVRRHRKIRRSFRMLSGQSTEKGTHIAFCSGNMSPNIRSISRDYPRSGSTPCIIKMTRKGMLCKHCCYALFQRWPLQSPLFLQSVHEWHVRKPSD